ncbi:MAG TPA: NTP transferase domain-containing protein [Rhodanobacteraceae bacterium]|nr:NTP transferase domain-containing protein [Rhodanobacteraceae bacterium]
MASDVHRTGSGPGSAAHGQGLRGRNDVLGVVFAGGAGARVGGKDKGLLPFAERPLIEHVLECLHPQCGRVLIVANRNLDAYAGYAPAIHDEGPGCAGPLAGLLAAFGFLCANRHALPRWLLSVPVDCPDPPRDLAARMGAALSAHPDASCAYAECGGKPQPLFALYRIGPDPAVWQASARSALHGHGSPWRWHAALRAVATGFDDAGDAFHNLNTPGDFQRFERVHGRS